MSSQSLEPRGVAAAWPVVQPGQQLSLPSTPVPGYGAAAAPAQELTLATLWRIVWEWRWLILSAVAAGLGIATVVTLLMTPVYRSTATLELTPPTVAVMGNQNSTNGEGPVRADDAFVETQIGLLKSRALAERVAQDLNLASNPLLVPDQEAPRSARQKIAAGTLMRDLEVTPVQRSRLLKLDFASVDPTIAARVANGYADAFIQTSLERRYQSSSYARDFLQRQIANVRRELEVSERQLVAYAQQQGIINTGTGGETGAPTSDANSLAGASLIELNRALNEAQAKRILAEKVYNEARSSRPTTEGGERTAQLRAQRAGLQAEYQDKLTVFQADYPEMVRLESRIDSLDQAISTELRNVQAGRSGTLAADYQSALAAEGALRSRVNQLRSDVLDLRGRSIKYNVLQRDVDTNRTLYDGLLQRYKEIGVAQGIGNSYAAVVDRGDIPGGPYSPNLLFNLLIGLFLGTALGVAMALALEFVNDTIKTPDDVRDRLRLAFLGGIPALKGKKPAEALRDPLSPLTEAFFSTGTSIGFTTEDGAPRSMLVTSTRPAEGKSTSTWALAQHFARLGRSVLLVDADLRKPAFVTGHEKEDGLSTLLTTRDPIEPHVIQTDVANLWLLPCGPIPPNPAELLASSRMQVIVDEATGHYDMVIVDGPPILGLADSPLIATTTQATLMVVEAGKTRTRAAIEALNRMRASGANVIGCVLMRYRHEATGYGYGYDAYSYKAIENRERAIHAITGNPA